MVVTDERSAPGAGFGEAEPGWRTGPTSLDQAWPGSGVARIRRGPDQASPGSGVARMRRSPDHGRVDRRRHAPAADLIFTGGPGYTADAARRGTGPAGPATRPGRAFLAAAR